MVIRRHGFSERFIATIQENVELDAEQVIAASGLLRFLHSEMKAASRGAKARKNLANHSAIYATVEDYRNKCPNPDEQIRIEFPKSNCQSESPDFTVDSRSNQC